MASDWIETKVGDQIRLQRGFDITKAAQRHGSVPVVSSGGVSSFHDTAIVSGPGVVLGRKGVVGSVFYIPGDYWPHDTSLWVKDFCGNDERFVFYFFKWVAPRLAKMDVGSANPTLNRNHVHALPVHWPPIHHQKSIACILGSLDDKIELNRRMNETLEAIARETFVEWFCSREQEVLGSEGGSGSRDTLDSFFAVVGGGTPKTSVPENWGGGIPWYSVADAPTGSDLFVLSTEKTLTPEGIETSSVRLVEPFTTIISARGTVGKLALAGKRMGFNQSCYALVGKPLFGPCFVHQLAKQVVNQLTSLAHGSVFSTITRSTFSALSFPRPATHQLEKYEHVARPLYERILVNVAQAGTLAQLRDTLLPKLISGQLRIPDAERIVSEVA